MKKNPGRRLLVLWLFFVSDLTAFDGVSYDMNVSTLSPYVKEPVIIEMNIKNTRKKSLLGFEFSPVKGDAYEILFLGAQNFRDKDSATVTRYRYAIFVKKSAEVEIGFDFIIKSATVEEVKESAIGARNVLKVAKTTDTKIDMKSLRLSVRELPPGVQLVGRYKLLCDIQKKRVEKYSQTDVVYTLLGEGYSPSFSPFEGIKGVDSFSQTQSFDEGMFHKRVYHYAFLADRNFTIPEVSVKAYDPFSKKIYSLFEEEKNITVFDTVWDKNRVEDSLSEDESFLKEGRLLGSLLWFLGGFFTALAIPLFKKRFFDDKKRIFSFPKAVKNAKNDKELLKILLSKDRKLFFRQIKTLEEKIYGNGKYRNGNIKKEILKRYYEG